MDRRAAFVALGAFAAVALSGCSERGPQAEEQRPTAADGGIRSANGVITEWPAAVRRPAGEFSGPTDTGGSLSSAELRGQVVVLNFWYAGCPPCRVEAPDLEAVWRDVRGDGVRFVGVNVYDSRSTAAAFADTFGITYPSILDRTKGSALLAFSSVVSVKAAPTTLVLDRRGRVAARIIGRIPTRGTLRRLVQDALAETG